MWYFKWKRQTQWNHGSNGKQSQQLPKPLQHGTMINDYYELEWEVVCREKTGVEIMT